MISPNLVLLYVEDPTRSARFYERLFERPPVAAFPTYAAFTFDSGLTLGLWSTHARDFVSGGAGHRSELAFIVDDDRDVQRLYDAWRALGVPFEQAPTAAVFGLTFVALDPDGHRLRVCTPDE
ncbi:glyoxalase [Burkholderia sp. MSh2]|uniref:Glyoxalase n=1 Tax=Burkholderia paludis TaxID=1506587 RepID=A0A6P2IVG9_9BURK|nr:MULTISPECIES: VOC family protein [Burkholderia]KEZ05470.1 glyoxalase [Burkholderia sp. MSh2]KFG95668.1 glyoxalase [Burkholderia paludis]CAB3755145.1 Phenazine antibiotic resistance protein EhpR [Burkholderia paludis]VWB34885.1 glyoxalase [Burkholderia paludis]